MYMPDSAGLERFRGAIAADGSGRQLARIVAALRRKGYDVATHDTLKSPPRGYKDDHPRIDLLRMKDPSPANRSNQRRGCPRAAHSIAS